MWALGLVASIQQLNTILATVCVFFLAIIAVVAWWAASFGILCFYTKTEWKLNSTGNKVFYKKMSLFITLAGNITQLPLTLLSDGSIEEVHAKLDSFECKLLPSQPKDRWLQIWETPLRPLSIHTREISATHIDAFTKETEWVMLKIDYHAGVNILSVIFPKDKPPKGSKGEFRIGGHKSEHPVDDRACEDGYRMLLLRTKFFSPIGSEFLIHWKW